MLRLMADGAGNRAIGDTFGLSEHRVKQQISTIFDKWGANHRAHVVAIALRQGVDVNGYLHNPLGLLVAHRLPA